MKILHISDLHIWSLPLTFGKITELFASLHHLFFRSRYIKCRPITGLKNFLDEVKPDVIVVTGDLTSVGSKREFLKAYNMITELNTEGIPMLLTPGNHDMIARNAKKNFYSEVHGQIRSHLAKITDCSLQEDGLEIWRDNQENIFIGFDISNGRWDGISTKSEKTLSNTVALLNGKKNSPRLILYGHYPIATSTGRKKAALNPQSNRIFKILSKYKGTILYLCGHTHRYEVSKGAKNLVQLNSGTANHSKQGSLSLIEDINKGDHFCITRYVWNDMKQLWVPCSAISPIKI